ncbi:MAG: DUF3857 and transglutaminase domain-containing protein [Acidobacteriia bacterium]|nr:DUF3857 and transglutaminase domain-containing protein [Terriglobia bacterium]
MHAVANAPLLAHDDKTDAVLLYSDQVVTVQSENKVKTVVREAYKILRPDGRRYGMVRVPFGARQKITKMIGWCIPAQGKDFEVKEKEAIETSLFEISGSELINDVKDKVLQIPAAEPGNIVGYEYEVEEQPYVLQDAWYFQESVPVREAHFTLQLPPGWEYKSTFLNAAEVKPTQSGNQWQWSVSDVKALKREPEMPPWRGVAGQMIVSYYPAGGSVPGKTFADWRQMGIWYTELIRGRKDPSPEMQQKVTALTAASANPLEKMRTIAAFVQKDIRYVAIELGIGGWQPHPAAEVFTHRYGDCKDKATLMATMLGLVGVESYPVSINVERGSVTPDVQAHLGAFDHVILAIKLPDGVNDASLHAIMQHPKLGKILFFDPTNDLTPFGQIGGYLQDNYGLLDAPDGGELVKLPRQPGELNSIRRTAKLTLTAQGELAGDVLDIRLGDRAAEQREALRTVSKDTDRIKPIETLLSHSLTNFKITKATIGNLHDTSLPFQYAYSLVAPDYAKMAGNLFLVRPRVVGSKSSPVLETKEPRQLPLEFDGPLLDSDSFEITLPPGYEVDELPPPVSEDHSFASYHSKTEVNGNVLHYTRTMEIKELSVPVSKMEELKKFYRVIATDERNNAVLKPAAAK